MCVFCKIINNEFSSYKVYEDEEVLAILDLSQTTYGHTLVMPKKHYDNMLAIPQNEWAHLMEVVKTLSEKIMTKLNAKGFNILINTNEAAGQTVNHLHVHIIPRYDEKDTIEIIMHENDYNKEELLKTLSN